MGSPKGWRWRWRWRWCLRGRHVWQDANQDSAGVSAAARAGKPGNSSCAPPKPSACLHALVLGLTFQCGGEPRAPRVSDIAATHGEPLERKVVLQAGRDLLGAFGAQRVAADAEPLELAVDLDTVEDFLLRSARRRAGTGFGSARLARCAVRNVLRMGAS